MNKELGKFSESVLQRSLLKFSGTVWVLSSDSADRLIFTPLKPIGPDDPADFRYMSAVVEKLCKGLVDGFAVFTFDKIIEKCLELNALELPPVWEDD